MRFYGLGTWSFAGDELFTYYETKLWTGEFHAEDLKSHYFLDDYYDPNRPVEQSQLYRLPFLIPLSYYFHELSYQWFGNTEFGSRLFPALFGILSIGMIYLLAVLGGLIAWLKFEDKNARYWLLCSMAVSLTLMTLPLKIIFFPWYTFCFVFPYFGLAALFIDLVRKRLRETDFPRFRLDGGVVVAFVLLLNVPSLLSYYTDGNRMEYDNAFGYVRDHWRKGDMLVTPFIGFAEHYLPGKDSLYPLRTKTPPHFTDLIDEMKSKRDEGIRAGRIWIVTYQHRNWGTPDILQRIDMQHGIKKSRMDYMDHGINVLLIDYDVSFDEKR